LPCQQLRLTSSHSCILANSSKASSLNHTGWATYGLPESYITRKQLQKESGLAPADMAAVPLHDEMGKLYLQHDQECALGAANLLQMVGHLPTYQGRVGPNTPRGVFILLSNTTVPYWCTYVVHPHLPTTPPHRITVPQTASGRRQKPCRCRVL
jgi:hypothetical protein